MELPRIGYKPREEEAGEIIPPRGIGERKWEPPAGEAPNGASGPASRHLTAKAVSGITAIDWGSWPVSRVLSWIAIHLGATSPSRSSSLPGNSAGHAIVPLFGLAPGGVYLATACYHPRGALLPHPFTLTCTTLRWPSAVYSLLHFPSARAAQALPGTVPYGARTFLDAPRDAATIWPTPGAEYNRAMSRVESKSRRPSFTVD